MQRPPTLLGMSGFEPNPPTHPSVRPCAIGNSDFFSATIFTIPALSLSLRHRFVRGTRIWQLLRFSIRKRNRCSSHATEHDWSRFVFLVREIIGNRGQPRVFARTRGGEGRRKIRRRCFRDARSRNASGWVGKRRAKPDLPGRSRASFNYRV